MKEWQLEQAISHPWSESFRGLTPVTPIRVGCGLGPWDHMAMDRLASMDVPNLFIASFMSISSNLSMDGM